MKENWKNIPNYDELYIISNYGNVKNKNRNKLLKKYQNHKGYLTVTLSNIKKKKFKVHQLVAMAFLGHKPNGNILVINHKDCDKKNNHISNLEIISNRENTNRKHLKHSSKYVGVYKNGLKWRSGINIEGKTKHLGTYKNEYDAHLAYEKELSSI